MSLPYFPMFPTDFDADTGHLSFAEDGAYNRLLRLSWRCPGAKMPDDLDWICRKARAFSDDDRALIAAILSEFFTRSGGKVFSRRLAKEWDEAHAAHNKRVSAGSRGGKAKALKTNKSGPSNAKAMLKQPEPEPYSNSDANASDGDAVADDFSKQLFDRGVAFLGRHGIQERQARSIIGKWRKEHSDRDVFDAFAGCAKAGATDPVPWIVARLKGAQAPPPDVDLNAIFASIKAQGMPQ